MPEPKLVIDTPSEREMSNQNGTTATVPVPRALQLHFHGPLSFEAGPSSLFHSALADKSCVYLWTIQSAADGRYYIHYVGEALAFARRQREHLIHILGLNYGIFDPDAARQGMPKRIWSGMWRDKSADGPSRALQQYSQLATRVVEYVRSLAVFVAPIEGGRELRRHVEGSIGWNLRNNHKELGALYPDDNHVGTNAARMLVRFEVSFDAPIAGLDAHLDI